MTSAPPPAAPPPAPPPLDPPYYYEPPPPPPVRNQLRRSRTDKVIGGVAGGLARYSGIDPLLWRVGFVALAFAGGTGVLVYLLLWLLMPAKPGSAPVGTPAGHEPAVQPAEPPGPRSPVPGVTVAVLLIVLGVLAMLDRLTGWHPGAQVFIGSALLVVGLGLVAAAFSSGRTAKGGLIALGVVLSLALLLASTEPWQEARGGIGDRTWTPATADAVQSSYDSGLGDVQLDLRGVDVSNLDRPIRTTLHHGAGDVTVDLPPDADVRVDVSNGAGDVSVLPDEGSSDGLYQGEGKGSWVNDGTAEIVLTIDNGFGDVRVRRG
jgi:phage shock protein PspC (stress-responsive transcriptional regulator)